MHVGVFILLVAKSDEMGAELGFEGPVVPIHFLAEAALEAAEAAGIQFFKSGFVHKQ